MRKVVDDVRLMVKVCDLYYNGNVSQQQIAAMLNLSRPTVSRLLVSAREKGIVQITVSNLDTIRYWEMERKLEDRYQLREVIIVDSASDQEELKTSLGRAAGQYLESTIKNNQVVGVSMGSTLHQVVSHVTRPSAHGVTFVPLIGGMGQLRMDLHSNNLAEALRLMRQVDVAIVGIGCPFSDNSSIAATGYFKDNEIDFLREKNVAGDICMQFYNAEGDTSPFQKDNIVIGIDIHRLKNIPHSIGVAGGLDKLAAIKGAINGHYINILITDIQCAEALLSNE